MNETKGVFKMINFIDLLYDMTDNTKHGLDGAKKNALTMYKIAKQAVIDTGKLPTQLKGTQVWENYCVAQKVCNFLGVRI